MTDYCCTVHEIKRVGISAWDRSDEWLAMVAELLDAWAFECEGEPAVGMWVLRDADVIVGTVGIRRRRFNGRLELCRLHVRPESRGRGLSKRLIGHALSHAHAHSQEAVKAQVREDNVPAVAALTSFGFREISRAARHSDGKTILLVEEPGARGTHSEKGRERW